jgi:AcrR family transcriptional regulator
MGSLPDRTEAKRREIADKAADYLLTVGLQGASLRPLAAALGTSDRMLLHYFTDKEQLVGAALDRVAGRLLEILSDAVPDPQPFAVLVPRLAAQMRGREFEPYFRVWIELGAASAAGEVAYRSQIRTIATAFQDWIAAAIADDRPDRRATLAALAMAAVDGCALLDALGLSSTADAAITGLRTIAAQA